MICMNMYIYTIIHMYVCVGRCAYVGVGIYLFIYLFMYLYVCMCIYLFIFVYVFGINQKIVWQFDDYQSVINLQQVWHYSTLPTPIFYNL